MDDLGGPPLFLETSITYIAIVYWSVNLPSLRLGSIDSRIAASRRAIPSSTTSTPKLHGWHSTKSYTRSGTAILPESSPVLQFGNKNKKTTHSKLQVFLLGTISARGLWVSLHHQLPECSGLGENTQSLRSSI